MESSSVTMPDWMRDEIDERRHSLTSRSEWLREAAAARLNAEDRGEWDEIRPGPDDEWHLLDEEEDGDADEAEEMEATS